MDGVMLWCPPQPWLGRAPADLAGTDVPAVAGMKLLAVAEVHSSAVDDEGAPLVIHTSKQPSAVVEVDPVWADKKYRGPMDGMPAPEPLEHSYPLKWAIVL